jgi:RNA polymerase sigma-70 factor, ECF subfamily
MRPSAVFAFKAETAGGNCHGDRNIFFAAFAKEEFDPRRSLMRNGQTADTTGLLHAWARGEQAALDQLTPHVYDQLRRLAGYYMQNESPARTIQATGLVHEAYLRLVDATDLDLRHRGQFFAMTARIMRNILLDNARARSAAKRGGRQARVDLDDIPDLSSQGGTGLMELDDALTALAAVDPRKAQVIELRFFGGLSVEDTAAALNISAETVMRDARAARAWLRRELSGAA